MYIYTIIIIYNALNIYIRFNNYFCNVKTRVYGLYLCVSMYALAKGEEQLIGMAYHSHCYSTPGSVVKDHQHNLQDNFITIK